MRILFLGAAIVLSPVHNGDAVVVSGQNRTVASELTEIEQKLVRAWIAGDRGTVDSILAADWSVIDLTGHVLTKPQVMQELGSGDRRIESGSVDELNVRVFGEVAIVTGRSVLAGS